MAEQVTRHARLQPGRFLGRTRRQRNVAGLMLADVGYPAGARLPRHAHERPYFCLIRSGGYDELYARRARACRPMMLVYHPPGEQHSETLGSMAVASFNVELGPEWLCGRREDGASLDQPVELTGGPAIPLAIRLFEELRHDDRDSALAIEALTTEILSAFARQAIAAAGPMPRWLREASEVIDANLPQAPDLQVLAAAAGVHPVHFAAVFRRAYGCPLGDYVRRRRIEHARRLLADAGRPLAHVGMDAGFADQSHFNRVFKRFVGLTPGEYRTFLTFKTR